MGYAYTQEQLFRTLDKRSRRAAYLCNGYRSVSNGLVSVGLKLHILEPEMPAFYDLVEHLGGPDVVLEINRFKLAKAHCTLVLPPVGSAGHAIEVIQAISDYVGRPIFRNPNITVQVCSPGRLSAEHTAILGVSYCLGSDRVRRYSMSDLETTFSDSPYYPRARRLVLYDADGTFERDFPWWTIGFDETLRKCSQLPMDKGRSDMLVEACSETDLRNINFVASLLSHIAYDGAWRDLGVAFVGEVRDLLARHSLLHVLDAYWVRSDQDAQSHNDDPFFFALQELAETSLDDLRRYEQWKGLRRMLSAKPPPGILSGMNNLLREYRERHYREVKRLETQGGTLL